MRLTALSLSWLAGILFGGWLSPFLWGLGLLPALGLLLLGWRRRRRLLPFLCLLLLLLGGLRLSLAPAAPSVVGYADGTERQMLGRIESWGIWERGNWLSLRVEAVRVEEGWQRTTGTARLYLSPAVSYREGDRLWVMGKPEPWTRGDGVTLFYPRLRLVEKAAGLTGVTSQLRQRLSVALAGALPQPQAGLAQALVLGERGELPPELRRAFNRSGAAHLLAISGLHIAVLAGIVLAFGAWALGRQRPYYLLLALALLWGYVLLSGLQPPAVRAGIMASLFLWAQALGRPGSSLPALAFAAALMAGLNPPVLREVSFQLSFAAMAGLVLLAPPLLARGEGLPGPYPVKEGLAYSLAAWLATLPLVLFYFSRMPLAGMPATLLALPALPWTILGGALTALAGAVAAPLGYLLGWLAWLPLLYMGEVVAAFALLPTPPVSLPLSGVFLYYVGLALLLSGHSWGKGLPRLPWLRRAGQVYTGLPHRGMALPLLAAAGLVWAAVLSLPEDRLRVSVLEVGEGDAILVQRGFTQVLIDGGPDPVALAATLGRELPFWDRRLEGMVLTSPGADRLTGLLEALRRYRVSWALEPTAISPSATFREWQRRLEAARVTRLLARSGMRLGLGDAYLEVLHDNPTVLRLSYGRVSFLFTSAMGPEVEQELRLQGWPLQSVVLQVGHGGAATTSPAFLAAASPRVAVVSGKPPARMLAQLRERVGDALYITGEKGRVTLLTDGRRLWVSTAR